MGKQVEVVLLLKPDALRLMEQELFDVRVFIPTHPIYCQTQVASFFSLRRSNMGIVYIVLTVNTLLGLFINF